MADPALILRKTIIDGTAYDDDFSVFTVPGRDERGRLAMGDGERRKGEPLVEPAPEARTLETCKVCGEIFDVSDPRDVLAHAHGVEIRIVD